MQLGYNNVTHELCLVVHDPNQYIFFDPISLKEYDYPWVFADEADFNSRINALLEEQIHHLEILKTRCDMEIMVARIAQATHEMKKVLYFRNSNGSIGALVESEPDIFINALTREVIDHTSIITYSTITEAEENHNV
jgi:hypothetical protein